MVQYVFNVANVRCRKMMEETRLLKMERPHHGVECTLDGGRKGQNVNSLFTYVTEEKNFDEELMNNNGSSFSQTLHYGH